MKNTHKACIMSLAAVIVLFSAITFTACEEVGSLPVIAINTQPASETNVTAGSISGSLTVSASVTEEAELSYQWYSNTTNSNVGGTEISGATNADFPIPTTLTAGEYFYFVEVRASGGAVSVRSDAAMVMVSDPADPVLPVISITTQPANTNVNAGSISGSLNVAASVTQGATISYQW